MNSSNTGAQAEPAHIVESITELRPKLTAILIVRDEADCLGRCLRSLAPIADEVVVVDSGSTDDTVAIARSFGARVEVTDWAGFGPQKNRALAKARGEWILSIDADESVTPELAASIRAVVDSRSDPVNGWFIPFLATWCGKPVRFGDWGGKRHLRLFRRSAARFSEDLVHERVLCDPPYGRLEGLMLHDTVTNEADIPHKSRQYAELGAQRLRERGRGGFASALYHAAWTFVRGFVLKGGFLDGAVGWKVARINTWSTWLRYRLAGPPRR